MTAKFAFSALSTTALVASLCIGCGESSDPVGDGNPGGNDDPAGGTNSVGDPGAGSVDCTFYYRASNEVMEDQSPDDPAFQFEEHTLTVAADESESMTLEGLTLNLSYSDDAFEGGTVSMRVTAGDIRLFSTLYQLQDRQLPTNQFVGGHGFTGLMYLNHPTDGGDYQLLCKSVP